LGAHGLDGLDDIHSSCDAAEDDVLAIEPVSLDSAPKGKAHKHVSGVGRANRSAPLSFARSASRRGTHRKNCEPFVLGPALAIERMPGPVYQQHSTVREVHT